MLCGSVRSKSALPTAKTSCPAVTNRSAIADPMSPRPPRTRTAGGISPLLIHQWDQHAVGQLCARKERSQILQGRRHHSAVFELSGGQFWRKRLLGVEHDFQQL